MRAACVRPVVTRHAHSPGSEMSTGSREANVPWIGCYRLLIEPTGTRALHLGQPCRLAAFESRFHRLGSSCVDSLTLFARASMSLFIRAITPSTSLCLSSFGLVSAPVWFAIAFAALSAFPFPSTPACAGIHLKLMWTSLMSRSWIDLMICAISNVIVGETGQNSSLFTFDSVYY